MLWHSEHFNEKRDQREVNAFKNNLKLFYKQFVCDDNCDKPNYGALSPKDKVLKPRRKNLKIKNNGKYSDNSNLSVKRSKSHIFHKSR